MHQVWIPKLLASFLESQFPFERGLLSVFLRTIRAQSVHFFYESSCRVLEGWVAAKLYFSFALRHHQNSLLSTLSQFSRVWNRMDLEFPTNSAAFHFMPSIHVEKHIKNKEDQVGNEQHLVTMNGNESFTRNSLTIRFTFAYMPLQTYQIFYSSYKNVLLGIKRCLLVLLVKVVGALEA